MAKDCNMGEWQNDEAGAASGWLTTPTLRLDASYIIDISCVQSWMGSCGSETGTFERLLAGPGQSREDGEREEGRGDGEEEAQERTGGTLPLL